MAFITKARATMSRAKSGLVKASPYIHAARRGLDAVDHVTSFLPVGGGTVHALAKTAQIVDNAVQKLAGA
jgi:hypothetical protein